MNVLFHLVDLARQDIPPAAQSFLATATTALLAGTIVASMTTVSYIAFVIATDKNWLFTLVKSATEFAEKVLHYLYFLHFPRETGMEPLIVKHRLQDAQSALNNDSPFYKTVKTCICYLYYVWFTERLAMYYLWQFRYFQREQYDKLFLHVFYFQFTYHAINTIYFKYVFSYLWPSDIQTILQPTPTWALWLRRQVIVHYMIELQLFSKEFIVAAGMAPIYVTPMTPEEKRDLQTLAKQTNTRYDSLHRIEYARRWTQLLDAHLRKIHPQQTDLLMRAIHQKENPPPAATPPSHQEKNSYYISIQDISWARKEYDLAERNLYHVLHKYGLRHYIQPPNHFFVGSQYYLSFLYKSNEFRRLSRTSIRETMDTDIKRACRVFEFASHNLFARLDLPEEIILRIPGAFLPFQILPTTTTMPQDLGGNCPICLREDIPSTQTLRLSCDHQLCVCCFLTWKKNICPCCRAFVTHFHMFTTPTPTPTTSEK